MAIKKASLFGMLMVLVVLAGCSSSPTSAMTAPTATTILSPAGAVAPPSGFVFVGAQYTVSALDARTGHNVWSYKAGAGSSSIIGVSALTVAGNDLLFLDSGDSSLYALSTADGALRWKVGGLLGATGIVVMGNVAIAYGSAYQSANSVVAMDLRTGATMWKQPQGAGILLAGNGSLYESRFLPVSDLQPITNGFIHALNPQTGAVLWQATGRAYYQLALVGNVLYASAANTLYAFDAQRGTQLWSHDFPESGTQLSGLTIRRFGTTLYVANAQHLYAIDGISRQVLWQAPALTNLALDSGSSTLCASYATPPPYQPPTGVTNPPAGAYGLSASMGHQAWFFPGAYASLLSDGGLCVVGSAPAPATESSASLPPSVPLTALAADAGQVRWTQPAITRDGEVLARAGMLYMVTGGGETGNASVSAVSEADGSIAWHTDTGYAVTGAISLALG